MKTKLFTSIFVCAFILSLNGQVSTTIVHKSHPISTDIIWWIGTSTSLGIWTDSTSDFKAKTLVIYGPFDIPAYYTISFETLDSTLLMTGHDIAFGIIDSGSYSSIILLNNSTSLSVFSDTSTIRYDGLKKIVQTDTFYGWLSYKYHADSAVLNPTYIPFYSIRFLEVAWNNIPNMPLPMGHDCYALLPDTVSACYGGSTDLTATGGINFLWSTGDTTNSVSITATQDSTYSVTATGNNGCADTASVFVKSLQPPVISFQPSATEICPGDSVIIAAQGGISFEWNTGDTGSSVSIYQPDIYSVTVTDEHGCTNSASIAITSAGNYPTADFNFTVSGDTAKFENLSSEGIDYYWTLGDSTISNNSDPEHIFPNGTYDVCLIVSNDCGMDSICKTVTVLDSLGLYTFHLSNSRKISMYPNPAHGILNLECLILNCEVYEFRLYDVIGKNVLINQLADEPIQVDVSRLKPGIHFYSIHNIDSCLSCRQASLPLRKTTSIMGKVIIQ